jgi:hypothetical protein
MELQTSSPSVEHAEESQFGAEVFGMGGDVLQGGCAFPQEQPVACLLMGAQPWAECFGHREGDQVIRDRQEFALLLLDPKSRIGFAALRTGAVIAGVVDKMLLAAVWAAIELPAQSGSATSQDCLHCPAVGGQNG